MTTTSATFEMPRPIRTVLRRRPRRLWLVAAGVVVVAAVVPLAATPASADSSYPGNSLFYDYNTDGSSLRGLTYDGPNAQQSDWMKWVDDSTGLANLSIPGTHDSMSQKGGVSTQTQGLCGPVARPGNTEPCDLTEQLTSGIRFFDIRVTCLNNELWTDFKDDLLIFHGDIYQSANLGHVLDAFKSFLADHPTETVLMRLQHETPTFEDKSGCTGDFEAAGYNSATEGGFAPYWKAYPDLFWTNGGTLPGDKPDVPWLGAPGVRGHVVVLQHFDFSKYWGLNWNDVADPTSDNWDKNVGVVADLDDHWKTSKDDGLDAAAAAIETGTNTTIHHTFIGGSGGVFPNEVAYGNNITGPASAPGVNSLALKYLFGNNLANTGILSMDFPGAGLINAIIAMNLGRADLTKMPSIDLSFEDMVNKLAYSTRGNAAERGCALVSYPCTDQETGFFSFLMTSQKWQIVVYQSGSAASVMHDGLHATSNADGYHFVLWNVATDDDPRVYIEQMEPAVGAIAEPLQSGQPFLNAHLMAAGLRDRFPGTLWRVVARNTGESGNDLFLNHHHYHKGAWHGVEYWIAGYSPGRTETHLAMAPAAPRAGDTVTYTATVFVPNPALNGGSTRGAVKGTVVFHDGTNQICSAAVAGTTATCSVPAGAGGSAHSITASFSGGGFYESSSSRRVFTVLKAGTTTTLTSDNPSVSGQAVTYTATVAPVTPGAGTPTGTVKFTDGTTDVAGCEAQALTNGETTCTVTYAGTAGSPHAITAAYTGDANFNISTSSALSQIVNKAATSSVLTSSDNPSVSGQAVTYTAAVAAVTPGAGTPTGTVKFTDGTTDVVGCEAQALTSGETTCTVTYAGTAGSPHAITAAYAGDGNFNISTSSTLSQTVNKAGTAVTVTQNPPRASFGDAFTLTATVRPVSPGAGVPAGTVTFFKGEVAISAPVPLVSGAAELRMVALLPGQEIVGRYSGNADFTESRAVITPVVAFDEVISGPQAQMSITSGSWLLDGATLSGSLRISGGASVVLLNSTVSWVDADGGGALSICGTTVKGALSVTKASGYVMLGDTRNGCSGNSFGNVSVSDGTGGTGIGDNEVAGTVRVAGNSGSGPFPTHPAIVISNNVIVGSLNCSANSPAPVSAGRPNRVNGAMLGQCSGASF